MAKRKLKQSRQSSDDESESPRPPKQFKKQSSSSIGIRIGNTSSFSAENDSDSDIYSLGETSGTAADTTQYESFSSFLKAASFCVKDSDDEHQNLNSTSRKSTDKLESSMDVSERRKSQELSEPTTSQESASKEKEVDPNLRILSIPSMLTEIVFLKHPASVTLHGYVNVLVWHGSINIFGYALKEGDNIKVFSTEGTGLKKAVTSKPRDKLDIVALLRMVRKRARYENIKLEEFENVELSSIVLVVRKVLLPPALRFLELYYPSAIQLKWSRSETNEREKYFQLCSDQKSYVTNVSRDFKLLSKKVNRVICKEDDACFGPRILVRGEKNMGKSTLIQYLINSALNKVEAVYFLDTDPGQTEYTPPGVVSLFRVTKPLLGPSFAHQKKPLRMIFTGTVSPSSSPILHKTIVYRLVNYFNENFPKETLFVNTMGWTQGMGKEILQYTKLAVKPTIDIELTPPDDNASVTGGIMENQVTLFQVPSQAPTRESGAPSYTSVELRNFNIVAYLGQCQRTFLPVSLINSFHPVCVSWDKIALYVMGNKVPAHRLVEVIHCSIVGLCYVDPSYVLKSDNPDFPMTLSDEPICECLGYGLVRASDETNHLFYIVTPLPLSQLRHVNALVKGNVIIPEEIFLKQTIEDVPLPFTNQLQKTKTPGLKSIPKRAFRNTLTPKKRP